MSPFTHSPAVFIDTGLRIAAPAVEGPKMYNKRQAPQPVQRCRRSINTTIKSSDIIVTVFEGPATFEPNQSILAT